MNNTKLRILSILSIWNIGKGVVLTLFTKDILNAWRTVPRLFLTIIDFFRNHPVLLKIIGITSIGFGIWMGYRMKQS